MAFIKKILLFFSLMPVFVLSESDQIVEDVIEEIKPRYIKPVGAPFRMDPNSPEIQNVANNAVAEYNKISRGKNYFILLNVTSAEAQVTNTITYKLNAEIGRSKCKKSEDINLKACALGKKRLNCHFEIQFHPSKNKNALTDSKCKK
ncbi:cystatin [Lepisosteus oculatus]|uniref:cystatin n=1 Tax=Lepisosteus oculatus TaxID=7918 RepID=UPI00371858A6